MANDCHIFINLDAGGNHPCLFSRSSNTMMTIELPDSIIKVWNVQAVGNPIIAPNPDARVTDWQYNVCMYQGNWSIVRFLNGTVTIWDPFTWTCLHTLHNVGSWACCAGSPDGVHLAIGSDNTNIKIWNVHTNICVGTLLGQDELWFCKYASDGSLVAGVTAHSGIRIWDPNTGSCICGFGRDAPYTCDYAFSPRDATWFVTTDINGTVTSWNTRTGVCVKTLAESASRVYKCVFSPDGMYIAMASIDKTISIWHVYTNVRVHTIQLMYNPTCFDFSYDGSLLVTSSGYSASAHIWHIPSRLRNNVKLQLMIIAGYRHSRLWLPPELWDWVNSQWFFY